MNNIMYKDLNIEHICKKNLKHSYISVKANANSISIVVKTPKVSQAFIDKLLEEKEAWIRKQLVKLEKLKPLEVNLQDEVLLFGEIYSIDSSETQYLREKLNKINISENDKVLESYNDFYKIKAKEYLIQRVDFFASEMNLHYSELKFKKLKSRWGSCSSKRVITLNTELMKVKKELIDYVVVHELSHLVHMNHSKKFHDLVDVYVKNSYLKRKELRNISLAF